LAVATAGTGKLARPTGLAGKPVSTDFNLGPEAQSFTNSATRPEVRFEIAMASPLALAAIANGSGSSRKSRAFSWSGSSPAR
jgi:hypothetical protein